MPETDFRDPFEGPDKAVAAVCKKLLDDDSSITLRSVATRIGVAHTTLGRNPDRKAQIELAAALQKEARRLARTRRGAEGEAAVLAKKDAEIKELRIQVELLTASHIAMFRALGERGIHAWRGFFPHYDEVSKRLRVLQAVPDHSEYESGKGRPFSNSDVEKNTE